MKRVIALAGVGLIAALAAVLLGTSRVAVATPQVQPVRLPPVHHTEAGHAPRRRCVRLGWKAPYWYAGGFQRRDR
jgi:hypothetical protein